MKKYRKLGRIGAGGMLLSAILPITIYKDIIETTYSLGYESDFVIVPFIGALCNLIFINNPKHRKRYFLFMGLLSLSALFVALNEFYFVQAMNLSSASSDLLSLEINFGLGFYVALIGAILTGVVSFALIFKKEGDKAVSSYSEVSKEKKQSSRNFRILTLISIIISIYGLCWFCSPKETTGTPEDNFRSYVIDPIPNSVQNIEMIEDPPWILPDSIYCFRFNIIPDDLNPIIMLNDLEWVGEVTGLRVYAIFAEAWVEEEENTVFDRYRYLDEDSLQFSIDFYFDEKNNKAIFCYWYL